MRLIQLLPAILALLLPVPVSVAGSALAEESQSFRPARALERTAPRYPDSMAARRQEGWVTLRLSVDSDGRVTAVALLEASNGDFTEAAMDAVRRWRFEPAMAGGIPVASDDVSLRIAFVLNNSGGRSVSSRAVRDGLTAGDDALRAGRLEEAAAQVGTLYAAARTLNDYAFIYSLDADLHIAQRRLTQARLLLDRAAQPDMIDDAFRAARLQQLFRLEAQEGLYADAIRTYGELEKTGATIPPAFTKAVQDMRALAASDEPMTISMVLTRACTPPMACADREAGVSYMPMRRTVTLTKAAGDLTAARAVCRSGPARELDPRPGAVWSLEPAWGDCRIVIRGAEDAVVTLSES